MVSFCGFMGCWRIEVTTAFLFNGVSIIGGKLVGSVGHGNNCENENSAREMI